MFFSRKVYGFQFLEERPISRRQPLSQEFIEDFKRERIALALSAVVHEVGFPGLTVSTLTKQAGMARNTFYELFDNREAATRFALAMGNSKLRNAIRDGAADGGRWPGRMEAVIGRLLDAVAAEPQLAELCLVHGRCVGDAAAPFDRGLVQTLVGIMRAGRRSSPKPGPGPRTEDLVAYGVLSVIAEHLRRDETESLGALAGELSELAVRPFGGLDLLPVTS